MDYLVNLVQERYKHWKQIKRKIDGHEVVRSYMTEEIRNRLMPYPRGSNDLIL